MQFQRNDKKTFCPACVRGAARKGSAAGKKASAAALHVTPSRKPRTCGEKYRENAEAMRVQGSPPRMRGKATGWLFTKIETRITPAYAGKRVLPVRNSWMQQDHPRVCGEKTREVGKAGSLEGSPPRMRGKAVSSGDKPSANRITPAHAGKSGVQRRQAFRQQDHPRACGEKLSKPCTPVPVKGSPPRVRGKEEFACKDGSQVGITPACAGKSFLQCQCVCLCWDHPRVCGEKTKKIP